MFSSLEDFFVFLAISVVFLQITNRISEKALFTLVLLGGGVGGILGMYIFHHKTQKPRFVVGFPFILLFEIAVGIFLYF